MYAPAPQLSSKNVRMILFIGNPGAGKSTLLNSLIRRVAFRSGVSIGCGLTTVLQEVVEKGTSYVDTPGLEDDEMKEKAAKEIEKALCLNGKYHVFFVITLEAGRRRTADVTTMQIVLKNVRQITNYSVIINKLEDSTKQKIEKDPAVKERLQTHLMVDLPVLASDYFFISFESGLFGADDTMWEELPAEFIAFIKRNQGMHIRKELVNKLPVDELAEIRRSYETKFRKMEKCSEALEEELERQKKLRVAMEERLQETEKRHVQICTKKLENLGKAGDCPEYLNHIRDFFA